MFHPFKAAWLPALALAASQVAWAQATVPRVAGNPLNPQTPTTNIAYQSAFAEYRSWADEPIKAWREANDEVGQFGEHAGHGMSKSEATESNASPAKTERSIISPPIDHAGHR